MSAMHFIDAELLEALALPVRKFGTVCHKACEHDISYKRFKTLLKTYMFD